MTGSLTPEEFNEIIVSPNFDIHKSKYHIDASYSSITKGKIQTVLDNVGCVLEKVFPKITSKTKGVYIVNTKVSPCRGIQSISKAQPGGFSYESNKIGIFYTEDDLKACFSKKPLHPVGHEFYLSIFHEYKHFIDKIVDKMPPEEINCPDGEKRAKNFAIAMANKLITK